MTGAEKERAKLRADYEAAYLAAYDRSTRCTFNGRRFRVGNSYFTREELKECTARLRGIAARKVTEV